MFRRGISVLIVLCLLAAYLVCIPAAALGETKVTISGKVKYKAGKTTISWKVDGSDDGYYRVSIQAVDNGPAEQARYSIGETDKHSIETFLMVPGKKYEVTIRGLFFNILAQKTVKVPDAPEFEDGKLKASSVKITLKPAKMKVGGTMKKDLKEIKEFKASEIIDAIKKGETYYGLKYIMKMPQLKKSRKFYVTLAYESPDGYLMVDKADSLTFDRVNNGYQTLTVFTGEAFFGYLYKLIEDIPKGTYKVHLFWDGMKVQTKTFKVN